MVVADQLVVSFHYILKNHDGEVMENSEGGEPARYLHGVNGIIRGIEEALTGKAVGDEVKVRITPENGYGEYDVSLLETAPRTAFANRDNITVGQRFEQQTEDGVVSVYVSEVNEDTIVIDKNHPLAGQMLFFELSVVDIREATAEEIDHGHAH